MLLAKILTLNTSNKSEDLGENGKIEIEYPEYFLQGLNNLNISH
jgi:hypothetical protein